MTIGIQPNAARIDEGKLTEIIANGGQARRAAIHRPVVPLGVQTFRQTIREDKTALRDVLDPDSARYRSQFGYKFKDQPVPYIIDGLSYGRFELERINRSTVPYDQRQRDLVEYFMQAEDRIFFAGSSLTPAGGKTGLANAGTTVGTNYSVAAGSELDLTTITKMTETLAAMIGQQLDHFQENVGNYSLLLAVSTDVDDWINGLYEAAPGVRMKPEILKILAENGNGGAGIIRTPWLGATLDLGNGNLPIKKADGAVKAALMMWSETNPLYEVVTTDFVIDSGTNEVGRFNADFTEGYLPMSYDPYSIIYSGTVDITP